MNKGLFYHCLAASLIFHLAIVLLIMTAKPQEQKRKEPIAIDLLGPLTAGPKTVLPPKPKTDAGPPPTAARRMAKAVIPRNAVPREVPSRPFLPSFPMPAPAQPLSPETPGGAPRAARPTAPSVPAAQGEAGQPAARPNVSSAPSAGSEGKERMVPRKLKLPTKDDLERYAKVDEDVERTKDPKAITLDTEDLQYTSYMRGLKRRIETIWKYPETARRDGVEGDLLMKFTITKSGKVTDVEIVKSSGYPMLDEAAKQALLDANPFNPLPDNWKKDAFTITGNFVYRLFGPGHFYWE